MAKKRVDYAALFTLRKDGRYCYSYTDESKKRKYLYDTDPEALYHKVQKLGEKPEITFGDVAEAWWDSIADVVAHGTRSTYKSVKERAIEHHGDKAVADITAADIFAVLLDMRNKDYSAKTLRKQRSVYKMILDFAIVGGHITSNPAAGLKLPNGVKEAETREAPEADVVELIRASKDAHFGLFPYFLLYTGLRKGEALALTWGDVNFETGEINVSKSVEHRGNAPFVKTPKTKAGIRSVPLLSPLRDALVPGAPDELIFPGADGELMHQDAYDHRWRHWCKEVGLMDVKQDRRVDKRGRAYTVDVFTPKLTAHQLRHCYATILFEAGVDVFSARDFMGHKDIATTQKIYTHLRKKQRDGSKDKLEQFFAAL